MVWKDTARHRHEIIPATLGPHSKALPYVPPYQASLDNPDMPLLPLLDTLLLPAPSNGDDRHENEIETIAQVKTELQRHCEYHVLPGPIVDRILSVMGDRKRRWYRSPLRLQWAKQALTAARDSISKGNLHETALGFATVFGTLMPSLFRPEATQEEKTLCDSAWKHLVSLADPVFLLQQLGKDMWGTGSNILEIQAMGSLFEYERIGPHGLRVAEQIEIIEKKIIDMESQKRTFLLSHAALRALGMEYYWWPLSEPLPSTATPSDVPPKKHKPGIGQFQAIDKITYWIKDGNEFSAKNGCILFDLNKQKYCILPSPASERFLKAVEVANKPLCSCWTVTKEWRKLPTYSCSDIPVSASILETGMTKIAEIEKEAGESWHRRQADEISVLKRELARLIREFEETPAGSTTNAAEVSKEIV
jgi:hypothetical protein